MDHAIRIDGLVKRYGPTRALDGLDLRVEPGEVHGFLGPNGAGKTTTLRVLLGLLLGALAASVGEFLNNPTARDFIRRLGGPHALSDAFVAAELGFAALMAAAFGVRTLTRAATEERAGRVEPILSGPVSRDRKSTRLNSSHSSVSRMPSSA